MLHNLSFLSGAIKDLAPPRPKKQRQAAKIDLSFYGSALVISYILTWDESPKRQVHDETSIRTNKTRELGQPKTSEHRDEGTVEPCKELQESKSTAASFGILWSSCRFSRFNVFSDVGDFLRFNRHFFNFPNFLTSNGQIQFK